MCGQCLGFRASGNHVGFISVLYRNKDWVGGMPRSFCISELFKGHYKKAF